jgi:peptide-methionine (R)-S-oxide reductase
MEIDENKIREKLTREEYEVLRNKGTEASFSGELLHEKRSGKYSCKVCGNELFKSESKFDSGTGWPSFDEAIPGSIIMKEDLENGMNRTEVICAKCKSHLGHIFNDGPTKTGKRLCINSVCLGFNGEGNPS